VTGGAPIRVMIVDDQAMVREGFAALLRAQPDMTVVADAADGAQAVAVAREHRPDVILMDIRMPQLDGIAATRAVLATPPGGHRPRVLILTTFDLDDYVFDALSAGASGFLLKDATGAELVAAVRVIAAGESLLAPSVTRRLIEEFTARGGGRRPSPAVLSSLTARELDVLRLIARGQSNLEIAATLVVAEQTVKTHVTRVFAKLDVRDRAQAVILAYETGLISPGS
jgi:DNA-binding NarL/FixJ family response regulator